MAACRNTARASQPTVRANSIQMPPMSWPMPTTIASNTPCCGGAGVDRRLAVLAARAPTGR
uniref:hypothetical protein n=1 Tax=Fodinicola feengrottensis TaxID=435914 RepID=UPI0036F1ADEB